MSITLDIKYAARLLHKKPVFTALTVFIVAIGLGLTLYTYSLLSNLVFKPLLLNKTAPIVSIEAEFDHSHLARRGADPYDFLTIRNEMDSIAEFGIYEEGTALIGKSQNNSSTRKYNAVQTEWNIFKFTDVKPIMGRALKAEDHFEGAEPVVVLSHDVWENYFVAQKDIVDSIILVNAIPTRVLGVMPRGFSFPTVAQLWLPISQNMLTPTDRSRSRIFAYARLKKDLPLSHFEHELATLNKKIEKSIPEDYRWRFNRDGNYLRAVSYKKASITQFYSIFITMAVVVVLILLLACINVGNLLLARVNERFKEVAIRIALGVPRKRLILQMLLESIFICIIGGFLAILFAGWGLELSNSIFQQMFLVNQQQPFWWQLTLDTDAIVLLILSVVTMIAITGFIPAWRALSGDFNAVLRDGTRGSQGKKAARASQTLVVSEILLSCVVLVIATILLATSYSAAQTDYGVDTKNRITATVELPESNYPIRWNTEFELEDTLKRTAFYYQLKDTLEQMPNIEGVVFMSSLPGTGGGASYFEIKGKESAVYDENPYANNEVVSRDSWTALGMTVIQGRDFSLNDISGEADIIIINESIAQDFFPDGDALGQKIRRAFRTGTYQRPWQTIVGVVSDTYHGSAMQVSSEQYNAYRMLDKLGYTRMNIAMHYTGSKTLAEKSLQQAINQVNSNATAYHIQSYDDLISQPMILVTAISKVFLLCGIIAVFLAASGIYAVAANSVSQRTQEIGIRRALGASDSNVMRLFMKQAFWQLAIGLSYRYYPVTMGGKSYDRYYGNKPSKLPHRFSRYSTINYHYGFCCYVCTYAKGSINGAK